ncbi:hypothetical protein I4U23_024561 [Adineta vaga]|nr:hypothetical protein I4U23_024561 [Adineta vaga]
MTLMAISHYDKDMEEEFNELVDSFRTNFGIDEYQWSISCDCLYSNLYYRFILKTLPDVLENEHRAVVKSIRSHPGFNQNKIFELSFPTDERFLTIDSTFERLTSLTVLHSNNQHIDHISSQLQLLLDSSPRLYSLIFRTESVYRLEVPLTNLTSKSIHQKHNFLFVWFCRYFLIFLVFI